MRKKLNKMLMNAQNNAVCAAKNLKNSVNDIQADEAGMSDIVTTLGMILLGVVVVGLLVAIFRTIFASGGSVATQIGNLIDSVITP